MSLPYMRESQLLSAELPNAHNVAFSYYYYLLVLLVLYVPGSPFMISHMWRQRRKELAPKADKVKGGE